MTEKLSSGDKGRTPQQPSGDKDKPLWNDALGEAGYMFAPPQHINQGGNQREISIAIVLPRTIRNMTFEEARQLLAKDPDDLEAGLLPGWNVLPGDHPDMEGWVGIAYDGPEDESLKKGVGILIQFATPEPPTETEAVDNSGPTGTA